MKKLCKNTVNRVADSIRKHSRPLELKNFEKNFFNGSDVEILMELKKFQNEDGGFGHALESDIRMPNSSPKCTTIGIRYLSSMDYLEEAMSMIKFAIRYLESTYCKERSGWYIGSGEINNHPHAPWWHFNEKEKMTVLDKDWGNPSAEAIAWLIKYKEYVSELDVDGLIETAISKFEYKESFLSQQDEFTRELRELNTSDYIMQYFNNEKIYDSRGEVLCYMKLYRVLTGDKRERLENSIERAAKQLVEYNESKWHEYVPMPLDFVKHPGGMKFGVDEHMIERNLDFYVDELEEHGSIYPTWATGKAYYDWDLKPALNEWIGSVSLDVLLTLKNYGRIE